MKRKWANFSQKLFPALAGVCAFTLIYLFVLGLRKQIQKNKNEFIAEFDKSTFSQARKNTLPLENFPHFKLTFV